MLKVTENIIYFMLECQYVLYVMVNVYVWGSSIKIANTTKVHCYY